MSPSNKKVKVRLTYEWEVSEKEYNDSRDFFKEQWEWRSDPVSLFHFLNEMNWPTLERKSVDRSA